jgi:hypothetical protein
MENFWTSLTGYGFLSATVGGSSSYKEGAKQSKKIQLTCACFVFPAVGNDTSFIVNINLTATPRQPCYVNTWFVYPRAVVIHNISVFNYWSNVCYINSFKTFSTKFVYFCNIPSRWMAFFITNSRWYRHDKSELWRPRCLWSLLLIIGSPLSVNWG